MTGCLKGRSCANSDYMYTRANDRCPLGNRHEVDRGDPNTARAEAAKDAIVSVLGLRTRSRSFSREPAVALALEPHERATHESELQPDCRLGARRCGSPHDVIARFDGVATRCSEHSIELIDRNERSHPATWTIPQQFDAAARAVERSSRSPHRDSQHSREVASCRAARISCASHPRPLSSSSSSAARARYPSRGRLACAVLSPGKLF